MKYAEMTSVIGRREAREERRAKCAKAMTSMTTLESYLLRYNLQSVSFRKMKDMKSPDIKSHYSMG